MAREYNILKHTDHNEEDSIGADITKKTFLFGLAAAATVFVQEFSQQQFGSLLERLAFAGVGTLGVGLTTIEIGKLLDTIKDKLSLNTKSSDLSDMFDNIGKDESRGFRK